MSIESLLERIAISTEEIQKTLQQNINPVFAAPADTPAVAPVAVAPVASAPPVLSTVQPAPAPAPAAAEIVTAETLNAA